MMVTRESVTEYIKNFKDEETRKFLTETMKRFDDRVDELIEKANSDLIETSFPQLKYINEYFVIRELLCINMKTDLNEFKESIDEFKKDVGYQNRS